MCLFLFVCLVCELSINLCTSFYFVTETADEDGMCGIE